MSKSTVRNTWAPEWARALGLATLAVGLAASASPAWAEEPLELAQAEAGAKRPKGAAKATVEVIAVRATKKSDAELSQEVPVAISAFSSEQLEARQVRNIESLTFAAPNVTLDTIGTAPGVANFEIRGLGVNSSIPSIDPTVGVFVDGMYLGVNYGVTFDTFDLEAVEVLRGPQGLLFGRNVTGGAVLLRSKRPGDELKFDFKTGVETGLEYSLAAGVEGPVVEGLLNARLSAMWRDDEGWFENDVDGKDLGAAETFVVRPVLTLTPSDSVESTVFTEWGNLYGQGPPAQNRGQFDGFDIQIDEPGHVDATWKHVIWETNVDVDFGDGKITNVFGYRDLEQDGRGDIDALPQFVFHADVELEQDQISNELRYSGTFFDSVELTAGVYYFTQDIQYRERRLILNKAIDSTFGGDQDQETWGLFTQADWEAVEGLILTAGIRYTYEEKDVKIATFSTTSPCTPHSSQCTFDFVDDDDWSSITPKAGIQYWLTDDAQVYGHYVKGFRSGGYNFRNTSPTASPGPFDEEEQDAFELGTKTQPIDGLTLNVATFYNMIDDLQREINLPDPTTGVVQVIRNTADATIYGAEVEANALLADNFAVTSALGYTHGEYDEVRFDLNGDGVVNQRDKDLDLPRLAEWSFSFGVTYDHEVGDLGMATLRPNYAYRDDAAYTDNNRGTLPSGHVVDASLAFAPYDMTIGNRDLALTFTVFGKNLANEAFRGGDTQLPPMIGPVAVGGTFSPLKEGRVVGFETRLRF